MAPAIVMPIRGGYPGGTAVSIRDVLGVLHHRPERRHRMDGRWRLAGEPVDHPHAATGWLIIGRPRSGADSMRNCATSRRNVGFTRRRRQTRPRRDRAGPETADQPGWFRVVRTGAVATSTPWRARRCRSSAAGMPSAQSTSSQLAAVVHGEAERRQLDGELVTQRRRRDQPSRSVRSSSGSTSASANEPTDQCGRSARNRAADVASGATA